MGIQNWNRGGNGYCENPLSSIYSGKLSLLYNNPKPPRYPLNRGKSKVSKWDYIARQCALLLKWGVDDAEFVVWGQRALAVRAGKL